MPNLRIRGAVTVVAMLALLVVVTAGCGRRSLPAGSAFDGAFGQAGGTSAFEATDAPTGPAAPAAGSTPDATEPPAGTEPPAATTLPVAEPLPTAEPTTLPDLSAIEQLLADLDAALGADATTDTEEGSAP
jgi:hypothetical protein